MQGMGLIPFMFYFGQDKPMEWDKEDVKVLCIAQFPIDIIMWVASFYSLSLCSKSGKFKECTDFLK